MLSTHDIAARIPNRPIAFVIGHRRIFSLGCMEDSGGCSFFHRVESTSVHGDRDHRPYAGGEKQHTRKPTNVRKLANLRIEIDDIRVQSRAI